jgi:CRISPR-associated helicase Cas3
MSTDAPSAKTPEQFFESAYGVLREQPPMRWMTRLFLRLVAGWHPKLVDLPTGTGKTDLAVIWILVLAWYGFQEATSKPVPRRLVWVVNRRVLVQQVFRLAGRLQEKLANGGADNPLIDVRAGLARLSGDADDLFRVVELRGQLIDDREWSVVPSVPQLIIGTVDQIGSRLLFQGYSLGKWSRPLQAALLAVDAWVCVDEAHLVPAFVLTLRQLSSFGANIGSDCPRAICSVFDRLPFWITELSATPALPPAGEDSVFRLIPDDENDPLLADRLLAARTRQVRIRWLNKEQKLDEAIQKAASALDGKMDSVAVFLSKARDANGIGKRLGRQFKERVLTITGRLRGYERDRLEKDKIFQRFRPRGDSDIEAAGETAFLVGTAAAEVGLDADAAAIVCDFASLPTLLQRLGRLDRRGRISRGFHSGECEAPTMIIFVKSGVSGDSKEAARREKAAGDIRTRMLKLAEALRGEEDGFPVSLLVGKHWRDALAKDANQGTTGGQDESAQDAKANAEEDGKNKSVEARAIVTAATWEVLLGRGVDYELMRWEDDGGQIRGNSIGVPNDSAAASPPATWLKHPDAPVSGGPVAVPPLTPALIQHWSGTTKPRNAFSPVHPFLYGILPDDEGTPLVGVAFRLEMDALATVPPSEDEGEAEDQVITAQIEGILRLFPPRRAELHFVPLTSARVWFSSPEAAAVPVAHFDGDAWTAAPDREDASRIRPGSILVLPTLGGSHDSVKKLLDDVNGIEDAGSVVTWDVLYGVSTARPRYWRRVVQVETGAYRLNYKNGASRIQHVSQTGESSPHECTSLGDSAPGPTWHPKLPCRLKVGSSTFRFEYLKPKRPVQRQFLDDSDGSPGHLSRAQGDADRIAAALAPGSEFLRSLLVEAAKVHDEGKRNRKWQRGMGNTDYAHPVAKPLIERPSSMGGFRHEWESLLKIRECSPPTPDTLSRSDAEQWIDLWRHLVAAHHGHLRPWISDNGFAPEIGKQQQSALRMRSAESFARLQRLLGPWRLAYLEALIKAADVASSQPEDEEDGDEQ